MRKYSLVAAAAVLLLAAGVALGAAGGGSSVINACVGRHGSLTVLSHGTKCGRHQRAVAWNQQGPTGPVGTTGPKGAAGVTGPAGPSFGDSEFVQSANAGVCTDAPIAQLPITVTTPSRIFATVTGQYYDNGTGLYEAVFDVELRDAGDTTTLAVLPRFGDDAGTGSYVDLTTDGVLRTGSDPQSAGTTAYVAQPGSYLLKWLAWGGDSCITSGHPNIANGSLTYLLLGNSP